MFGDGIVNVLSVIKRGGALANDVQYWFKL